MSKGGFVPNKKKVVCVCPCDDNNLVHFEKLKNSLRKFHSEEELPLIRADLSDLHESQRWYMATPWLAKELLKEYECVIKADADQIIVGDLSELWEGNDDVSVVLNDPSYPLKVWDIEPYYNNGLVVIRSLEFAEHWWKLCKSVHFDRYQFREQDLLNILCSDYYNYTVRCLDGSKIYGESAKPYWPKVFLEDNKLMFPLPDQDNRELKVIHFGGGNDPNKGNFRIRFSPEVVKRIEELIK